MVLKLFLNKNSDLPRKNLGFLLLGAVNSRTTRSQISVRDGSSIYTHGKEYDGSDEHDGTQGLAAPKHLA